MPRKLLAVLTITAAIAVGCAAPLVSNHGPSPGLAPQVDAIEAIPVTELSTDKPLPFDIDDPCASVPADVVTPAGLGATPGYSSEFGCVWRGSDLGLEIGALPDSMTKEVEAHLAMANGASTDRLAHLAWLRIEGHYAIERVLDVTNSEGCRLILDVSAPTTVHVSTYRIDSATGEPAESDADTVVRDICPLSRRVARNLLDHFDGKDLTWWETAVHPTR